MVTCANISFKFSFYALYWRCLGIGVAIILQKYLTTQSCTIAVILNKDVGVLSPKLRTDPCSATRQHRQSDQGPLDQFHCRCMLSG